MFQYFIYRLAHFIVSHSPLKVGYSIAKFVATWQYLCSNTDRNIVKKNLKAIFPEKSDSEIKAITKQVFINFGKYLADFLRFSKIDKEFIKNKVKIKGLESIDKVLRQSNGGIIITAHLGNWELAGAIMGVLGYKIIGIVMPHKHKKVSDFFNKQRQINNMEVCSLGNAARFCLSGLKQNKMVAVVADRDFTEHGLVTDFLNKKALLPKGAASFHLKTQAPIIYAFLTRCKDDTFRFELGQPPKFNLTGEKEKDIEIIIKTYITIIEKYIKTYPEQWFMFRKYWIDE
ncbi:MAG: hypothetical protein KJ593_04570 [Candidatus Omnitrophica bacterium]|nr:hypothetical protein [Candidatus Omnitrophota bacterium]